MRLKYRDYWRAIDQVNHEVNMCYEGVKEPFEEAMVAEDLRITRKGSCADFAYTKLLILMGGGIPSDCMGIAICEVPLVGTHAVLLVSTDQGDFVLDNRFPQVMTIADTIERYIWKSIPKHLTGDN
jgi:predicted transglutaminase-like cysteine proteinase